MRIIQTGKTFNLPLLSKAAVANVRLLNPDFEYLFFDNVQVEEFIDTHFPEYRSVFDAFRIPIQRYDFFRYLAVYQLGGFYLDLDVFLASGLEDLLGFSSIFPFECLTENWFLRREYGMDWEIGNYAFGAQAGHPFIRAVIENCVRAQREPQWVRPMVRQIPRMFREEYYVLYTTGPGLVSRTLAEYPDAATQVKVLFPENVCDRGNWDRFGSYGVHLRAATWRGQMGFFQSRVIRVWWWWTGKKGLKESLKLGASRSLNFRRRI